MYSVLKHAAVPTLIGFALSLVWAAIYGSRELVWLPGLSFLLSFPWVLTVLASARVVSQHIFSDSNGSRQFFARVYRCNSLLSIFHSFDCWFSSWSGYHYPFFDAYEAILLYTPFRPIDVRLAFFTDVLDFPTSGEVLMIIISWLLLSDTIADAVVDTFRYYTGIASLQARVAAQARRYAFMKSTACRYTQEFARVRTMHAHMVGRPNEQRKRVESLQHSNELSCATLASVRNAYADATATVTRLSGKKQLAEAACDATATRILELEARIIKQRQAAASQQTLLRTKISQRAENLQQLTSTVKHTRRKLASLKDDIQSTRQTDPEAELDAQRASFRVEQARLLADRLAIKTAHDRKLANLTHDISAAKASLEATNSRIHVAQSTRDAELVAMEECLAGMSQEVDGRRSELAEMKALCDELRIENDSIAKKHSAAKVKFARVRAAYAADVSSLTIHAAKHHEDSVERRAFLEERQATLVDSAAVASRLVKDAEVSLEFSIAEHKFHVEHCAKERASFHTRLTAFQGSLSAARSAKEAKAAEVAALRSQRDQSQTDQREELEGLGFRLKMVSEGYAGARDERRRLKRELKGARWAFEEEQINNRAAIRAYHRSRDVGNSYSDDLVKTLEETKARVSTLEAASAELASKMGPADAAMAVAALEERREKAEDELADAYEALSEKEIRLSRLKEELARVKEMGRSLEDERDDDRLAFNKQLKKAIHAQHELHLQVVERSWSHERRLTGLEERLAALSKSPATRRGKLRSSIEVEEIEEAVDTTVPEFLQGSSRGGTPEREGDAKQDTSSYPTTPALTYTSGTWSRSPSRSPGLPSLLLNECATLVARSGEDDVVSGVTAGDGAEVNLADS